jgi:hypothetical protein
MDERRRKSLWARMMRKLDGLVDAEVFEDPQIAFHLAFIVPVLIALVMLLRR